jgi:microcystin-dependent protein
MATTTSAAILGLVSIYDAAPATYEGRILYSSTSAVAVVVEKSDGTYGAYVAVTEAVPQTFANGDKVQLSYKVPVNELSSNVTLLSNPNIPFELAGAVQAFAGATAPNGWAICDGAAVSRSTYAQLFSRIGTTWGTGDGSTTFNLPDLRETTLVGVGTRGSGVTTHDTYSLGEFKDDQVQYHNHAVPGVDGASAANTSLVRSGGAATGPINTLKVTTNLQPAEGLAAREGSTTHGKQAGVNYIIRIYDAGLGAGALPISSANIVGRTDGVAPAAGMVGETFTISASNVNAAASGDWKQIATKVIPKGVWSLVGVVTLRKNGATITDGGIVLSTSTASSTGGVAGLDHLYFATPIGINSSLTTNQKILNLSSETAYFLNAYAAYSVATPIFDGSIVLIRIA